MNQCRGQIALSLDPLYLACGGSINEANVLCEVIRTNARDKIASNSFSHLACGGLRPMNQFWMLWINEILKSIGCL